MKKQVQTPVGNITITTPRNQKEFMKNLKPVYGSITKDDGEMALDKLEER